MRITEHGFAIIDGDTHIGKWAEESGRLDHDQNALPIILGHIKEGATVIDIGANIGSHSIAYSKKACKNGVVICFEPFKKSFECLLHNVAYHKNEFTSPIYCYNHALGAKEGFVDSFCEVDNYGMAIVRESKIPTDIKIEKLDTFFKNNGTLNSLDFLKIDAEGCEVDILIGASDTIRKFRPIMFIEINEHTLVAKGYSKNDLLKTVSDIGYWYRNIYEDQGLEFEQFDIICFPIAQ